ncbi:hypothetical protein L914_10207 [Phytophthora nicotianae]|uniref:Uncharacterized protein n=1 Tax=Phytophthora nicotianae TaxID=4792 RepID=W2NA39_PHYNI|nr:hypothetical protein L914_10207 [Phytophthora nicotianae]
MADQSELHNVRVPQPNDIPAYSSQLLRSNVVYRWGLHYDPTHSTERSFVDGAEPAWVTTWLKDEFAVEGFEELLLIPVILVVVAAMGIGWFCWKRSSLLKREQASSCDFDVVSPNYLDVVTHEQALRRTVTTTSYVNIFMEIESRTTVWFSRRSYPKERQEKSGSAATEAKKWQ